ncbi:TauD/TfdA family dioxygenase [Bordetella sp. BOR01]|uniref:TauD/TfdA dioxygenase family protein n=1 Tax=Bordetella sp. BOR01 TaxID=2854779 RepID=UPI001C4923F4|nr:TauD/TfdA family dioxygenase [Bordetella sp. BOR01]MBV7483679.1 TauD/TfdA family dioxygenase [Bordetella sp. BOR01]
MQAVDLSMDIHPLSPVLGVEVKGVNLANAIEQKTFDAIRDALHQHAVLLIRDQHLTPRQLVDLANRLGPLRTSFYNQYAVPDQPELTVVSNIVDPVSGRAIGIVDAGSLWHTDASYLRTPDMYTQLYALQVPRDTNGTALGDTLFTNTAAAYEALPADEQKRLLAMTAVHSFEAHLEKKNAKAQLKRAPLTAEQKAKTPDVSHPIVRTHPVTGRKSLFVSEGHTARVDGLSASESQALLEQLWAHIKQPQFVFRHRWAENDLLIWDNCSTQHLATMDYPASQPRRLYRAGVAGTEPY